MLIQGSSTEPMVTISTGTVKWFQNNSGGSSGGSRGSVLAMARRPAKLPCLYSAREEPWSAASGTKASVMAKIKTSKPGG